MRYDKTIFLNSGSGVCFRCPKENTFASFFETSIDDACSRVLNLTTFKMQLDDYSKFLNEIPGDVENRTYYDKLLSHPMECS